MVRFKDLLWFNKARISQALILGAGGIGSWVAFLMARAGFKIVITDFDRINQTNISGQLFAKTQIGKYKVEAIKEIILELCESANVIVHTLHASSVFTSYRNVPIVIMAFDNMNARRETYNFYKSLIIESKILVIDGRLLAEQYEIFCLTDKESAAKYEKEFLYRDEEVEEVSCTAKQTSHYAAGIASNIVRFCTNYLLTKDGIPAYVPFQYRIQGVIPDDLLISKPEEDALIPSSEQYLLEI